MWEVDVMHGMPLDHPRALPEAIRTGKPQLILDREDYIRRWPHGAEFPRLGRLGSDYTASITPSARPAINHSGRGW